MIISRLLAVGCITIVVMSTGCDETFAKSNGANNNHEVKSAAAENAIKEEATTDVQIKGAFKRSFEIYELDANGVKYYVFDPKHLLIEASKKSTQKGYYKQFDACVIGDISPKGKFGPLGRYHQQIAVYRLCE